MTRVATFGNYQSALLDLMKAQTRAADAQERVSTQKNATDLTGFGRQSETLTALKGAQSRIVGFMDTAKAVSARLTTQNLALTQIERHVPNRGDATILFCNVEELQDLGHRGLPADGLVRTTSLPFAAT